ncbi:uncharacterized protein LOC108676514 isoform X2 [Hyalella azteca]|uniref:Uncharacterized protein LOC108676514 isoform X2 n=1 Tax=Hyalella azteca TaxID=294128 RepID=A0A979FJM2_HYAAZ|nr:uncharacterized protein LOC108676514 isoform X2 [Hyalella azteca]
MYKAIPVAHVRSYGLKFLLVIAVVLLVLSALMFQHRYSEPAADVRQEHLSLQENQLVNPASLQTLQNKIDILERRLARMSHAIEKLWCTTQDVMSNGGFCVTAERIYTGGNKNFFAEFCYFVEELVGNASVADFGAGLGKYGMCLLRKNQTDFRLDEKQKKQYNDDMKKAMKNLKHKPQIIYSWHGFDGGFAIEEVSGGFIAHADLSEEGLWLGRKWDWVMSVEVGEHIDPKHEGHFLDNLVRHACAGILLTWAVEGQRGHFHVNNHNNDYIKQKMLDRGFVSDEEAEKRLRARSIGYLANTSMVFRRKNPTSCLTE